MQCIDGTFCNVDHDGLGCCKNHEGRAKCPMNTPKMCAKRECDQETDYCCVGWNDNCGWDRGTHYGGPLKCDETFSSKRLLIMSSGCFSLML